MAVTDDPQLYSSGYERNRLDRYWTHPWMTKELFRNIDGFGGIFIPMPVWECAAGRGDMSRTIKEQHHIHDGQKYHASVYSSDLDMSEFDESIGPGHERSFLDEFELPFIGDLPCASIITNPPYNEPRGIADKFIRHGLGFFDQGVQFMAMLLRSEFSSGKSRADMFGKCHHYMGELVLTTRPRWDYGDPDAPETAAPRHNFSWFLWQKDYRLDSVGRMRWSPVQLFSYMPKGFKS